jgi:formate dehydrogenase alpha subunit
MSNSIAELEDAPFILAVGSNTTEAHPVIALRMKKAIANGAKLIVVDPRGIEMTDLAHRWLRLNVGTDIALFNAMAHVIIEEGLYDKEYVAARTAGFEELSEFVKLYTPEYAEQITGVPREDIVAVAREYAGAERASICYTLGVTEHACGVHNVQSLANLALLCGNLGIPNAGVNPLRGQNNVQGVGDVGGLPNLFPGYQKTTDDDARARWEREWGVTLSPQPGFTKTTAVEEMLKGNVRAMYIMGENSVISDAHANKTQQALKSLDFLVVQDLFLTNTARLADVVLPAASFAEVDGTFTNSERRVQRVRKAVDPPGQAKPDWVIFSELATRLEHPLSYEHPSEIWDEMARNAPIMAGISYERIEQQGIQWPCPSPDHPGTQYLHKDTFASGKGHLQSVPHVPLAEPPDEEYPLVLTTGRRRPNYNTGTMTGKTSALDILVPHQWLEINPGDAAELGLDDGEEVEIVSRRGRVQAATKVTDRSPAGVVFMSFHFPETSPINQLTTDLHDPITQTAEYKACAVRVEKVSVGTVRAPLSTA